MSAADDDARLAGVRDGYGAGAADHCFVCGEANPIGLHVHFGLEADVCVGYFTPGALHVGFAGLAHGGIIFSLLDDVMANSLWLRGERGFTARCEIRYRSAIAVGTLLRLEGRVARRRARLVETAGVVMDAASGAVLATATAQFMLAATSRNASEQ